MRVRYSFSCRKTGIIDEHNKHRKEFADMAREIIEEADVILEVLDARFLDETRNLEVENKIKNMGKRIIFVGNKADLTDGRRLADKARELGIFPFIAVSCTNRQGSAKLRERIKIEASRVDNKRIKIGVIGYPNTGKSSVINFLVGRNVAGTAAQSGFTKGIKEIKLSEGVYLIDTPGVIAAEKYSMTDSAKMAAHAVVNARSYEKVKNPEIAIQSIMKQYPGAVERYYGIDARGDSEKLIEEIGKKKHLLIQGGEVDADRVARIILKDWQAGKIKI